MILCLAAPVVQDGLFSTQACEEQRWKGGEEVRVVGRRENVDNVVLWYVCEERTTVGKRVNECADILDALEPAERAAQWGVMRDECEPEGRFVGKAIKKERRLARLTAEDVE